MTEATYSEGSAYHAQDERGNAFTVWNAFPAVGDVLCRALTGSTEVDLVRRILAGEYDCMIGG